MKFVGSEVTDLQKDASSLDIALIQFIIQIFLNCAKLILQDFTNTPEMQFLTVAFEPVVSNGKYPFMVLLAAKRLLVFRWKRPGTE